MRDGIGGAALKAGDRIEFDAPRASPLRRRVKFDRVPQYADAIEAEVTAGPHADWLDAPGMTRMLDTAWKVTGRSDRTGIRLAGPKLSFSHHALHKAPENGPDPTNVINTGYPVGGINLCGDTPIILPVDGPSMGGFITPLVVPSGALWKVGQARPGQTLRLRAIDVAEAIELRRALDRLGFGRQSRAGVSLTEEHAIAVSVPLLTHCRLRGRQAAPRGQGARQELRRHSCASLHLDSRSRRRGACHLRREWSWEVDTG